MSFILCAVFACIVYNGGISALHLHNLYAISHSHTGIYLFIYLLFAETGEEEKNLRSKKNNNSC